MSALRVGAPVRATKHTGEAFDGVVVDRILADSGWKVVITGSRHWTSYAKIRARLAKLPRGSMVIVGGAQGADAHAANAAAVLGLECLTCPADWGTHGKRAGPMRNQVMIDKAPDLVLAFPMPDSVGTWDCVNRAKKAGIPVEVIL